MTEPSPTPIFLAIGDEADMHTREKFRKASRTILELLHIRELEASNKALRGGLTLFEALVNELWQTQLAQAAEKKILEYQITEDDLTGLHNRRGAMRALPNLASSAKRNKGLIAVYMIDCDGFKQVNDTLGHMAGDKALVAVAQTIRNCMHKIDLTARLGGDEFLVACELKADNGLKDASHIAARLCQSISKACKEHGVTASIGFTLFDPNQPYGHIAEVIKHADIALYVSKRTGRNRACFEPLPLSGPPGLVRKQVWPEPPRLPEMRDAMTPGAAPQP